MRNAKITTSKRGRPFGPDLAALTTHVVRDVSGQARPVMQNITLTTLARDRLSFALEYLLAQINPKDDLVAQRLAFVKALKESAPDVARLCRVVGRSDGPNAITLSGLSLSTDLRFTKALALALSGQTGSPFQFDSQNSGEVCAVLKPEVGAPPNSNASFALFEAHTDDPPAPLGTRVEIITLVGRINESRAETGFADIESILNAMSRQTIRRLLVPEYQFRYPASLGMGERWTSARPILLPGEGGRFWMQLEGGDGTRPINDEAKLALQELRLAIDQATKWFVVENGTAILFGNQTGVHTRRAITGAREIVRVYTIADPGTLRNAAGTKGSIFTLGRIV